MTDTRHTPGPWETLKIAERGVVDYAIYPSNQIGFNVAKVLDGGSECETASNARLIAAAPELLDVCEAFIGWIGDGVAGEMLADIRARARAAIEKARKE